MPEPKLFQIAHNNMILRFHKHSEIRPRGKFNQFRHPGQGLPTAPPSWDWTKSGTLTYPVDGNDTVSDCLYAAAEHGSNTFTGNVSSENSFNEQATINRYLDIAGGDNGLYVDQIISEWQGGIVGPNGPSKILDKMSVDPTDTASMQLAIYGFGGGMFTLGIPDQILNNNPSPGQIWNATPGMVADDNNGHGIWVTGYHVNGNLDAQTWGFQPGIQMTPSFVKICDPTFTVVFSLEWFDANGVCPTGATYDQLATLWVALGGNALPPSPFNPSPIVPPVPVPPVPVPPVPVPPVPVSPPVPTDGGFPILGHTYEIIIGPPDAPYFSIPWTITDPSAAEKHSGQPMTMQERAKLYYGKKS